MAVRTEKKPKPATSKRARARLHLWAERRTLLNAYIEIGPSTELRRGGYISEDHGLFSVRFASTSLGLLPEFVDSATIEGLGNYRTVEIKDQHGAAIRLTDDRLVVWAPTEAEIKEAANQLNDWAKAGTLIACLSGNEMYKTSFFGRVRPEEDGSTFRISNVEPADGKDLGEFGALISLKSAEILKIGTEEFPSIFLSRANDSVHLLPMRLSRARFSGSPGSA